MKLSFRPALPAGLRSVLVATVLGGTVMGSAGACGPFTTGEPPCFPPSYTVSPDSVQPGDTVTVSAPAANCNPRYGTDARIQVIVTDAKGAEVVNTTAPMSDAGEFTYAFTVPADMPVGKATVTAMPYAIDWCDDTGKNNRAGGATDLIRASCVMPVETLTITP
ncbi:hypothetical protein ACJJV6_17220 [Arthrobacter nitrophenolicus]|uniref:Uncharacterized protein n=1 Tax=Arthrobacter nitrophenolicus TaxID=683150 RepID=A0ACC6TIQ3_9MICC